MSDARIFRCFKTSPEIIGLAVMMYVRRPLSLRNVEDLLHERGIDIMHKTVRFWWNRFGAHFRGRDPTQVDSSDAEFPASAMARRRNVLEDQWGQAL